MTVVATAPLAVTVYPDRARVTRGGKVQLEPGQHVLEIHELPVQLNPDSLRVSAVGTARARLLGVQAQRSFYEETPAEEVRQLEAELESVGDDIQGVDMKAELVNQNLANLNALAGQTRVYARGLVAGKKTLEEQVDYFNGLRLRAENFLAEQQYLGKQRRELERRQQKIKSQLDQKRSSRPRERYSALIDIEVLQPGDLTIELSYLVTGAGWKPLYDFRVLGESEKPALEVGYLAQVSQNCGEAWENVSLTLSTARPALASRLPELDPWYIGPMHPVPVPRAATLRVAAAPAAMPQAAKESALGEAAPELFGLEEVQAVVDTSGASVTYQVPGKATIPPDGASHKVTVARFPLEPEFDYVSAPRLVEAVYRRAKVTNASAYTFLAGQANLFLGDEFVGTTNLDLIPPQGEIELYLGVDDRIHVERELKRREMDKRLIGGKKRYTFGYEIELENLLPAQVKIILHDQLPVARHEEIKVKLESADPKPTEQSELNLLDWELSLASKEKRTVRFDFSVECPQEMEVVGLL